MTQTEMAGRATGGKPINLTQLQAELAAAGTTTGALGYGNDHVHTYDASGQPSDFPADQQAAVDTAVAAHVALRDKTSAEYAAEFQDAATTAPRKQEIRDIQNGLLPAEQVPITQEEWDAR